MRGQPRLVAFLIGVACLARFSLGAAGYLEPMWLLGLDPVPGAEEVPFLIRIYAIRDVALAVLLASATASYVIPLLIGCLATDAGDLFSGILAGTSGASSPGEIVAFSALCVSFIAFEAIALYLIRREKQLAAG